MGRRPCCGAPLPVPVAAARYVAFGVFGAIGAKPEGGVWEGRGLRLTSSNIRMVGKRTRGEAAPRREAPRTQLARHASRRHLARHFIQTLHIVARLFFSPLDSKSSHSIKPSRFIHFISILNDIIPFIFNIFNIFRSVTWSVNIMSCPSRMPRLYEFRFSLALANTV